MTLGTSSPRSGLRRARSDRGALGIEMVLLLPIAFSLLFLAVQGAVYYQGRTVALAAAQEGARGAAAYEATDGDGRAAALDFTRRAAGDNVFSDPSVDVERDTVSGKVTVKVTGTTGSFVPGWDPEVSQSASRTIEDFTRVEDGVSTGEEQPLPKSWE